MQDTLTGLKEHIETLYNGATSFYVYEYAGDIDDKLELINKRVRLPAALVACAEGSDSLDEGEIALVIYVLDDSHALDKGEKRQGVAQGIQDLVAWLKTNRMFSNGKDRCQINLPLAWRTLRVTDRHFLAQIGLDVSKHFERT